MSRAFSASISRMSLASSRSLRLLFSAAARTPRSFALSAWSFMSEMSGEMISVAPRRQSAGT